MNRPTLAFQTFGCRLNQAEAEAWQHALIAEGFPIVAPEQAQVFCVHSCAVTETAVKEVVKFLRTLRKRNTTQRIILSGCASTLIHDVTVDLCIPHENKSEWLPRVRAFLATLQSETPQTVAPWEKHRTRASLILQDGCDQFCAYCIVPYVRGKPISEPATALLRKAEDLFAQGFREIVLTGCHLALYKDPESGMGFVEVLRRLCEVKGEGRFRIGSIEPCILDDKALIRLIAESDGRICPFLHFPMQSADDGVLNLMKRRYRQADLQRLMETVGSVLPDCGLSADWIVGHPGETPEAAQVTRDFVERYPFTGAHVFPYSKREGTEALHLPNHVPHEEILARAKALRSVAKTQQLRQLRRAIGKPLAVIPEQLQGNIRYGWSAERFRCQLPAHYPRGECVRVTPTALDGETLIVSE